MIGVAGHMADVARKVIGCHLSQETCVQYELDDMTRNICHGPASVCWFFSAPSACSHSTVSLVWVAEGVASQLGGKRCSS